MSILRLAFPFRRVTTATISRLKPGAVFQVRNYPDSFLRIHALSRPQGFLRRLWHWLTGRTRDVMTAVHMVPPLHPEMAAQGFWYTPIRWFKDGLNTATRFLGLKAPLISDAAIFSHWTLPLPHPFFYKIKERLFGGIHLIDGLGKKQKIRMVG